MRARASSNESNPPHASSSGSDRDHPTSLGCGHKVQNGSPGVSTPGDPGSNLRPSGGERGIDGSEEQQRLPEGAPPRKRRRRPEAPWAPPEGADRQHFTYYVLHNMVWNSPPEQPQQPGQRPNNNLKTRTGYWKYEHLFDPYIAAFPLRTTPKYFWNNGYLPGGLEVFWKKVEQRLELSFGTALRSLNPRLERLDCPAFRSGSCR